MDNETAKKLDQFLYNLSEYCHTSDAFAAAELIRLLLARDAAWAAVNSKSVDYLVSMGMGEALRTDSNSLDRLLKTAQDASAAVEAKIKEIVNGQ